MFKVSKFSFALIAVRSVQGAVLTALIAACGGESSGGSTNYTVPAGAPTAAGLSTGGGGISTPEPATSGAASGTPAPAASGTPPGTPVPAPGASPSAPTPTITEHIAALERRGAYPRLDRSGDIAGPDVNRNGVRDDIEAWINALPATDLQRKALMQDARATQQTLVVDLKDKAALQGTGERLMAAINCGGDMFSPYAVFSELSGKIEAMTANTRERAKRYMQYNAARSGSSTTLPNGNTCEP